MTKKWRVKNPKKGWFGFQENIRKYTRWGPKENTSKYKFGGKCSHKDIYIYNIQQLITGKQHLNSQWRSQQQKLVTSLKGQLDPCWKIHGTSLFEISDTKDEQKVKIDILVQIDILDWHPEPKMLFIPIFQIFLESTVLDWLQVMAICWSQWTLTCLRDGWWNIWYRYYILLIYWIWHMVI